MDLHRWAVCIALTVVSSLICVSVTGAGVPEEYAEFVHGSVVTFLWVWCVKPAFAGRAGA